MDNYNVGIGRVLKVLLASGVALVAAAAAVIGTMTVTGHGRFNASSGSAGVAAVTVIYHDSLTDRLMANMANAGAKYVVQADQAYDIGTVPLNKILKVTSATTLGESSLTDDGSTLTTSAGTFLRASPAAAETSTAGNSISYAASPAVAGTVTAGAAAGGNVNITAGAAARKDSGEAAGGDIVLTPGAGIGGGARGTVRCPGSGALSTAIGVSSVASASSTVALGRLSNASGAYSTAFGMSSNVSGMNSMALGGNGSCATGSSNTRLAISCNISCFHLVRKDHTADDFNSNSMAVAMFAGAPTVLFTNELDATQAAIANGSSNWTVAVASNVVTVNTVTAHKFSVGQYISTDADWTENAFMASLTDKLITAVTSTTFTFALTQANQAATTETNASAGITPGDYVLPMPTGGSFFVEEVGIVCSTLNGTITTQPTCQFGTAADRDSLRAAEITTLLSALRTRERYTTLLTDVGETTLACGMTAPATLNSATSYKIRFYFRGIFVEDE